MRQRSILLVDLDSVVFDWTGAFMELAEVESAAAGIENPFVSREAFTSFAITTANPDHQFIVPRILRHPELYVRTAARPLPGAVEAVLRLAEQFEVFFASTPDWGNPGCVTAKQAAIADHFGSAWVQRLILSADKTLLRGAWLTDDKPGITGMATPSWFQILFGQTAYNRDHPANFRAANWAEVLSMFGIGR